MPNYHPEIEGPRLAPERERRIREIREALWKRAKENERRFGRHPQASTVGSKPKRPRAAD